MTVKHHLAMNLVEIFENLLEEHGIIVPDPDRPDDNDTPLYGCTWANLVDDIEEAIALFFSDNKEVADILNIETLDIDISAFLKKFNEEYQFLYDNNDNVAGYAEALAAGNQFFEAHPNFIAEFARYRGDLLTSDREIAAFMFAFESAPIYVEENV